MSSMDERVAARRKNFKKAVDPEDARRKREEEAVQLRKAKKDEALMKKRMVETAEAAPVPMSTANVSNESFNTMIQALHSDDHQAQFTATQHFRKLLSIETNPPIQDVIEAGVVPRFIQMLEEATRPSLQFEAAWVLTNIASGSQDQTKVVVEMGCLPIFVRLLESPNDDVREQAVWALGNIAGDSPNFRDKVLNTGGLTPLMSILETDSKTSMLRNATWTLSNLCRGKPVPSFTWVKPALNILTKLVQHSDTEVLTDACWALSYLSDGDNERISAVIQSGVVRTLVQHLSHASDLVQTPALRAIGNIVTGDDAQTQICLQAGCLPGLLQLLSHRKKPIRKETCWTISNITAGNKEQIQDVINTGIIPIVIEMLAKDDFDIKKEAAWAISNATTGGTKEQIDYLVSQNCLVPLCDLLTCSEVKITNVALDAIDNILKVGKSMQDAQGSEFNQYVQLVEQCDGLSKIEALQEQNNEALYTKVVAMITKYWDVQDDEGDNTQFEGGFANQANPNFNFNGGF